MELDLSFTADGVPILMHDETVDRTTNGSGPVGKLQFVQLRRLDAAARHRLKYTCYQTITLICQSVRFHVPISGLWTVCKYAAPDVKFLLGKNLELQKCSRYVTISRVWYSEIEQKLEISRFLRLKRNRQTDFGRCEVETQLISSQVYL